jgi:hypothetical protein
MGADDRMKGADASEATRREFDEVMRSTRFASIEQIADLDDMPSNESATRPTPATTMAGAGTSDLPSRRRTPAG